MEWWDGERWLDLRYILKLELIDFVIVRLYVQYEKEMILRLFNNVSLSNWKIEL